ncbi:MAG: RNA-binding cell elongation regulator Jag/EloR [Desulfatiglans sp.]|jgi:spoIIIJ-associated protein|nr:RNA-binding cell elongation regulator Jag/EloR [Desulfatiglans sp.]
MDTFEAKNTEEAIEMACSQLNLTRDEIEIEILEPGSPGIFGLVGGRKAKIRVTPILSDPVAEDTSELEAHHGMDIAKETLEDILALIPSEEATVTASQNDGTILLNIEGDKSGLLIGRKGRTLDALQYIVNKIVNKALEKRTQVVVDSENYRLRRHDALTEMAFNMGDKAKKTNKPVSTNPLNPHDRRIVHLALRDDDELDTKSRGDGLMKKVLIVPKK